MESNGNVLAEFNNYCPDRFRLNINDFDLVDSKMCKDDISKSLFSDVTQSLISNGILSNGFSVPTNDKANIELKNQCLDVLTSENATLVNSDEPMWKNSSDLYDFSSTKKMSLNNFISADSFINGKSVLAASKGSFQIDNCYSYSKSAVASESSLDTTSDSLPQTLEENSSSSIEEIFCPVTKNPTEVRTQYNARVESQNALESVASRRKSNNLADLNFSQEKGETGISKICSKESGEVGLKKDRVMPELIPTPLICLDDDEEEDSIQNYEEKSPAVVSVADSPEMPKLVPFSDADDLLRMKAENLGDKEPLSSLNKVTSDPKVDKTQSCIPSLNESENVKCQGVDLQSCTRKLFPDSEIESVEQFKAKYTKLLSSPLKKHEKEVGFSFSSSFKCSKQERDNLCGIDLSVKKNKSLKDIFFAKSNSEIESKASEKEASYGKIPQHAKSSFKDVYDKDNFKTVHSNLRKSLDDSAQLSNKVAKKKAKRLSIDEKLDDASDSISSIHQPKILLTRLQLDNCSSLDSFKILSSTENLPSVEKITFEHCLPSNDSDENNFLKSQPVRDDNSSNEAPEIEEIEGIRFFQFRSKRDMEEFNRKPMVGNIDMEMIVPAKTTDIDMEMIVPTKTTDITQIKGWRNKYFADSQFQFLQSDDGNSQDESSQNAKSVPLLAGSTETKCLDFRNCLNANKTMQPDREVSPKSEMVNPGTSETVEEKKPLFEMSAFVSKDLDDFLLNSSTLNVSLLQKVNPNIIPIAPDATILGLGKLSQPDYELKTLAALKRRNFLNKLKEKRTPIPAIYSDSDEQVITLSSSSENSSDDDDEDDDVPVAKLHSGRKRMATSRTDALSPVSSVKRRKSDASLDGTSQRVVLRLTKESKGKSDGYKVSDISCEKQDSEESPSSSTTSPASSSSSSTESEHEELPDEFKAAADGSSPVIKDTIFLKESEPKLLEEFLNNLNVLGTSNDVAMLVQSNHSYFVKGPVLPPEMCSEALDALLSNKEFIDSKSKHTPKKKLKAWQKYLPKKLTKTQQQKITKIPDIAKVPPDAGKKILKPEHCDKMSSIKDEKVSTLKESVKHKNLEYSGKLSKIEKTNEKIINIKSQLPPLKEVPKVRKRRSRSAIELTDPFSLVERGKRSIRLPARYLDSAVLAAGSEWVSPIFVEEDKKTRKQLLDVLEKITPNAEILGSEDSKKITPKKDASNSSTPKKDASNSSTPKKDASNSSTPKKDASNSSAQPVVKKNSEDNNQQNKVAKRQLKTSNMSKRLKLDDVKDCRSIKESDSPKNQSSGTSAILPEENTYILPSCSCSPCSRTMSYAKSTKEFLCFSHKHGPSESKSKSIVSSDCTILTSETSQTGTLKDSMPDDIKLLHSAIPKSITEPDNKQSEIAEDSLSAIPNSVKESEIKNKIILPKGFQLNKTSPTVPNSTLIQKVTNARKFLTSKGTSVGPEGSKKLVLILPMNSSGANNSLQSKSYSVPLPVSSQKALQLTSDLRSKPPILIRKSISENPLSTDAKSSNTTNFVPSSTRVLTPTPVASSTPNTSPIVLKLPTAIENQNNTKSNSSQSNALTPGQLPNKNANVLSNLMSPVLQPASSDSGYKIKGIKIQNFYFCPPPATGNEKKSSPTITYLTNKNTISLPSSLPQPAILDSPNNAAVPNSSSSTVQTGHSSNSIETNEASSSTLIRYPLDLHNYNKIQTEHRRKSPLSTRVFKESTHNEKSSKHLSDSDIDIDTVDEKFKPNLILQRQLANSSGSDTSDVECDEIFSTNLQNVIHGGRQKSISERKRRLLMKKSFERLKVTSPIFDNAKNCADILKMASFAVLKLKKKEMSLRLAKRMLRLENAELLEKLKTEIKGVKDTNTRHLLKRRIIAAVANDWVKYREAKCEGVLHLKTKKVMKGFNSSLKVKESQVDAVPAIDAESQSRVVTQQLDFEVVDDSHKMDTSYPPTQFEVDSTDIEQPHVQLRILELPPNETDKEIISLMEAEVEVQIQDAIPMEDETPVKDETPIVDEIPLEDAIPIEDETPVKYAISIEDETLIKDVIKINDEVQIKDIQSPQDKEVNLPHQSLEESIPIEEEGSDGNSSDDDLLIIDLEEKSTAKTSPQKDEAVSEDIKDSESSGPISKFPGLVPLFPPEFYEENNPFVIDYSKFSSESDTTEKGLSIDAIKNSLNCLSEKTSPDLEDRTTGEPPYQEFACASDQLVQLAARSCQATALSSMPSDPNISPRNILHRTCKDVKILHGVGDYPDEEVKDVVTPYIPKLPTVVPEEIVIDDSDDEPMEVEEKPVHRMSLESAVQSIPSVNNVIDDITIEDDSPVENSFL